MDAAILLAPLIRPKRMGLALAAAWGLAPFVFRVSAPWEDGYIALDEVPLAWIRALGRWRSSLRRARVEIPVLVLQGDADNFLDWKAGVEFYRRAAPNARIVVLPGRGHILLNRKDAQVESLAEIFGFLDSLYKFQ